jgi:hypothetical protein
MKGLVKFDDPVEATQAIEGMIDNLSDKQKALVHVMKSLKDSQNDAGNETSLKIFGYKMFVLPDHWRLRIKRIVGKPDVSRLEDVKGYGIGSLIAMKMLEERVPHKNPAILMNVFDDFYEQVYEMATFTHLAIPTLDIINVMNHPNVETAISTRLGSRFRTRIYNMTLRLAHLRKHSDSWNRLTRAIQRFARNIAVSILGFRLSSVANNRVGGSILMAGQLYKLDPKIGADFNARLAPVSLGSEENKPIVERLLSQGYFGHRWLIDRARTFANLPVDEEIYKTERELKLRKLQAASMNWMANAEMRNVINGYKTLVKFGYSPDAAIDMLDKINRETQNPSTALEESGFYTAIKEGGYDLIFMFFGQPTVASGILLKDLIKLRAAQKRGSGVKKASKDVAISSGSLLTNAAFVTAFRHAVALAGGGLLSKMFDFDEDDDDLRRRREWAAIGGLAETLDILYPGTGRLGDVIGGLGVIMMRDLSPAQRSYQIERAIGEANREIFETPISRFGYGAKSLYEGIVEREPYQIERAMISAVEMFGMARGLPTGGPIQAIKVVSGSIGHPLGKRPEKKKRPTRRPQRVKPARPGASP